ncbi:MAG: transporter substrate-binding domain-containing protein [Clostridia bacterium]|nr:transporter substrate-binding domain-containing protein [Clostridia bacterium]MBQ6177883.1 transporter substrate-binding domain-containing protein [Bacteroidales bacterium]
MKKLFAMLLCATMLCMTFAALADYPEFTTIESGKLLVSTSPDFPPFESTDDDDNIVGIEPEIMALIGEKLGLEIEYMPMDFTSALAAAQTGKTDIVMSGVTASGETGEARKLMFDFTTTYVSITQAIVYKEGKDISMDNLGSQSVGVQRGTTGQIFVEDAFGEDIVVGYDTYSLVFQALQNDQIDCIVVDDMVAKAYLARIPGLVMTQTTFEPEDFAFGVFKGDSGLCAAISQALQELIDDGTVQAIVEKYNQE